MADSTSICDGLQLKKRLQLKTVIRRKPRGRPFHKLRHDAWKRGSRAMLSVKSQPRFREGFGEGLRGNDKLLLLSCSRRV